MSGVAWGGDERGMGDLREGEAVVRGVGSSFQLTLEVP